MRVLVTFAVDAEFAPWRKRHNFIAERLGDLETYRAEVFGSEVTVLLTGIGRARAGSSVLGLQMYAARTGRYFDAAISSGLAGALRQQYRVGDIVTARQVLSQTMAGRPDGHGFSCDEQLVSLAERCGSKRAENFYTENQIVITATEKAKLGLSAEVVEMESCEIVSACPAWGTRPVAIRAISDTYEEDLPFDFNLAVTKSGHISLGRMILQAARHPAIAPRLLRFGKQSRYAAEKLAGFLDQFVAKLAAIQLEGSEPHPTAAAAQ
jgi:nucleoside phosphorylase